MNALNEVRRKIMSREQVNVFAEEKRTQKEKIVFTNGCFDLLHPGHLHLLAAARSEGDCLVVGLNSDASVSRIKPGRPVQEENTRALMLAALQSVDAVVMFNEETPLELIRQIKPDVLVKGRDYKKDDVVGREIVESSGGRVVLVELLKGFSTTSIIEKIKSS